jgi:hypothetical protein
MSYLLARCAQASGDYVEQLTYLLFLEMADERTRPPWPVPASGLLARCAQAGAHKAAERGAGGVRLAELSEARRGRSACT